MNSSSIPQQLTGHVDNPVTKAILHQILPLVLLLIQCSLLHPTFAHSRLARLVRMSITPITFFSYFTQPFRRDSRPPDDAGTATKMGAAMISISMAVKSLEWGWVKGPYYTRPLKVVDGILRWEKVKNEDQSYKKVQEDEPCNGFELAMWTLLQLTSARGLSFSWGQASRANTRTTADLIRTILILIVPLTVTFVFILMTRDSPLGTPTSLFISMGVPNFFGLKILSEIIYSSAFGIWIASSIEFFFTFTTLAASILYKLATRFQCSKPVLQLFDPVSYPPLFHSPHLSSSLREFWGVGWHTLAQRAFLVAGGKPMVWIAEKIGSSFKTQRLAGLFGTFLASGIIHEYGIYAMMHPEQPYKHFFTEFPGGLFFFLVQPLGFLLEPFVIPYVPKILGGGRLWTWTFLLLSSLPFRDRYLVDTKFLKDTPPLSQWPRWYP